MPKVENLLESKKVEIFSVSPDALAFEVLQTMADNKVGTICVMEGDKLVGMFSERDYARNTILKGKSSKKSPVSELMSKDLEIITLADTLENCMAIMSSKHLRHLPVMDDGQLVGVISAGDVMKQIISDHNNLIESLEKYISGSY